MNDSMNFMRRVFFFLPPLLVCAGFVCTAGAQVHFRDITKQAGINFTHNNGATGKKWLPETMGPGAAFIDYDNDGYPDILLVNGQDWTASGRANHSEALPQQSQRNVYRCDGEGGAGDQHVRPRGCGGRL